MKTVCIIGGGFSGTLTAIHLLEKSNDVHVTLVNSGNPPAQGVAYSTDRLEQLLNVPAGKMSAFANAPSHFTDWLKSKTGYDHLLTAKPELAFLPRAVYGAYLTELLNPYLKNERLEIIHTKANSIKPENNSYTLFLEDGSSVKADRLVLAMGNYLPARLKVSDDSFSTNKNYFPNPWDNSFLKNIQASENILLVGTGLTMIDCVCSLQAIDFKGKIYALSPRGYLPESHAAPASWPDFYPELQQKNLQEIFNLVRKHLKSAAENNTPWQAVIEMIRPHTKEIWMNLSFKDKKQFISHLRHIWGVARHRLPAETYSMISGIIKTGQLEVTGGRLQRIDPQNSGFEVSIKLRKDQQLKTIHVARIVNCTGPQGNFNEIGDPFVKSLLESGLASPDELKMGIKALPSGNVLNKENKIVPGLYAVGSMLRGVLWETTAVPELRSNAENVAIQIINSIN